MTAQEPLTPELNHAFKAFKKRLKLARLDEESKLGRAPLTGGERSGLTAITPPYGFPPEVWEELARRGRLRHAGHGLYELL